MDYKELRQTIISYSSRNLEQRKNWYSPAAEAYNKARPRYPKKLIHRYYKIIFDELKAQGISLIDTKEDTTWHHD